MGREDIEVEENPRKGGLRTIPFIIVNESFEKVASFGVQPNMITYLMKYYQMSPATGASVIGLWNAFSNGLAIVGAFVSDSYLGRFNAVAIGSFSSFIGMIILWLTAMIPQLRSLPCSQFQNGCDRTTAVQLAVLLSSFMFISVGAGFVRPCSMMFGADQLEKNENPENKRLIDSYFNWYYASIVFSAIFAVTVIVFIQDQYGWQVGFGVPLVLMFFSVSMFLIGSPLYMKVKPKASLFVGLLQVVVASFRKTSTDHPLNDFNDRYHQPHGSELLAPSNHFRCLNRVCMIQDPRRDLNPDGSASNPWSLCSVEQVESLKALLKLLPMLSTFILNHMSSTLLTFAVLQSKTMDRHIFSQFEVPAASFGVFMLSAGIIWIVFYDRFLVPLLSKYTGQPRGISPVIRVGIGLILSCVSLALSAITETIRRERAIAQGLEDDASALVNMSAMWLVPQYALIGVAEAAFDVGQIEFFYSLLPKNMSSIASAMSSSIGQALSSLLQSLLVSAVDSLTSTGGNTSWLSKNLNKGHLDYFFWLLTFLCLVNFFYFLLVCRFYETGNDAEEKQYEYRLLPES